MKTTFKYKLVAILSFVFFTFPVSNLMAQTKTKKQLKADLRLEKQKQTKILVDSKEFVFKPTTMHSQGGRMININDTSYSIVFYPDSIKSHLPFFGRGYSGIEYGGGNGMRFEGKSTNYSMKKTKKAYVVKVNVKGERDFYSIMLSVYFEGSAYLTINSNNRSSISYNGEIKKDEKQLDGVRL